MQMNKDGATFRDINDIHPAVDQRKPSLLANKTRYRPFIFVKRTTRDWIAS